MITYPKLKTALLFILVIAIIALTGYNVSKSVPASAMLQDEKVVTIKGNVSDKVAAESCFLLLQENLSAANEENAEKYSQTLVKKAQVKTQEEMTQFFKKYDLKHTLLAFEVLKEKENLLTVIAKQKTVNIGKEKYRNHITQAHHTFLKEEGHWKIAETSMTDTTFID